MSTKGLLDYWPSSQAIADCLKLEAEASSEAVALAVHQPMRFQRRAIGGDIASMEECDEHQLLNAFLQQDLSEGRVILPIVGESGVGKSHIIRWLEAQMRRLPGASDRVVIRIPKGMSLRGVLGLLLDRLDSPVYEPYRKELLRAQESLDPDQAAGLLCEMLAQALTAMHDAARAIERENPNDEKAAKRVALCRTDALPGLFRSQHLRDAHFVSTQTGGEGVVKRLVAQLTQERQAGEDDDRKHVFTIDDLDFEDIDTSQLGRAERQILERLDAHEDRKLAAVELLNEALDEAKQRLVRLDSTVGDLFDTIRRELLREKKELILLVEDFAILSGLQKQLLQVMIKEAVRDGRQVLCTMRTALAYTSGYLQPATVLTRAGFEYRIPDDQGTEDEVLARIVRQVGAYLNAARVGQKNLERAYATKGSSSAELGEWIPRFEADVEPQVRSTLNSFGLSSDRYELFPFNERAIHQLAREGCLKEGGTLVYNPRLVISNVLRKVLKHRDLFQRGTFLDATFSDQTRGALAPRVVEHVERRVPPDELSRYLRFLTYWGGCPDSSVRLREVDEHIFAAFGLVKSKLISNTPASEVPSSTSAPPARVPEPEPLKVTRNPTELRWEKVLAEWRSGATLGQHESNSLRKLLAKALEGVIDWDWDLFRPLKEGSLSQRWFQWIYIPRASGGEGRGPEESMVSICTDEQLDSEVESARVVSAIMTLVQYHEVHGESWDFEGGEEALARYIAFLEPLAERARRFVRENYLKQGWDPLPTLVQGLLIGARALGIDGSMRDANHAGLIHSMLVALPGDDDVGSEEESDSTGWLSFTRLLRECRRGATRDGLTYLSWRDHLLNLAGARQGGAASVHAVDVARLKHSIEQVLQQWTIDPPPPGGSGSVELTRLRNLAQELRRASSAVEKSRTALIDWADKVASWFGDEFDKTAAIRELETTIEEVHRAGMMSAAEERSYRQAIEAFRNVRVKEAYNDARVLREESDRGTVLAKLGSGHQRALRATTELMSLFDALATRVDRQTATEAENLGDQPLADALAMLRTELESTITYLEEGENNALN